MAEYLEFREEQGCLWITPQAKLARIGDVAVSSEWKAIEATIKSSQRPRVIVDLSQLEVFGSLTLEWHVILWKRIRERDGSLVIYRPTQLGREILKLARFDTIWPIADTREAALEKSAL